MTLFGSSAMTFSFRKMKKNKENYMETELAKQLKAYMQEKRISQRQLANTLGISESTISRYLSVARAPNKNIMLKLSALGIYENKDEHTQETKRIIKQLIRQNIKHYSTKEKLELIRIIAR